eukprot:CAMPEP_0169474152 /NCGR_PEP_ID=MMETSP1042-20121227/26101_1 /TAXON_ID=464988 /ORGANISM="Hemiselmis andersenii, Strain CCMP1180" /LENGTH=279 /DNA_ID=CAMNT_0009588157 /DNA_START=40 /DNA_END=881 /DNA_ORIENTATION=+
MDLVAAAKPSLLILDLDETLIYACDDAAKRRALEREGCEPDFWAEGYAVFKRPHCSFFFKRARRLFGRVAVWTSAGSGYASQVIPHVFPTDEGFDGRVAVWTSAGSGYASQVIPHVFPTDEGFELDFVWTAERVTRRYDPFLYTHYDVKDLRKVKRRGYALERVLIVDDTKRKAERNYGVSVGACAAHAIAAGNRATGRATLHQNLVHVDPFEGDMGDTELLLLGDYLESVAARANYRCFDKRDWRSQVSRGAMPDAWQVAESDQQGSTEGVDMEKVDA